MKHLTLNASVRSYFQYHTGSKWEYVLSSDTHVKVTTTVENFRDGKMNWDAFTQEFFEYDLSSPVDSLVKLRAIADDNEVSRISIFYKDTSFKIALQWFYTGGKFTIDNGTQDSLNLLGARTVNGVNYPDVLELIPHKKNLFKNVWIARGVGIIRKEMGDGRVYLLRSYTLL